MSRTLPQTLMTAVLTNDEQDFYCDDYFRQKYLMT